MKSSSRLLIVGIGTLALLYSLLLIPDSEISTPPPADRGAFIWNQDEQWAALEKESVKAKTNGCESVQADLDTELVMGYQLIDSLNAGAFSPENPIYDLLEGRMFQMTPKIFACGNRLPDYSAWVMKLRTAVKNQSISWNMETDVARETLYRLLYGSRAALEELMLQVSSETIPSLSKGLDEPSGTPMASILGVNIHSGDMLVSRGGAAASALIARGNDFPGNFSHVALVHVDEKTNLPSIIEAHIEMGVKLADLEAYLKDKKLRVMVLRPRKDLPALVKDEMLPHKAAIAALKEANERHIPYDFAMDWNHHEAQFCSEVASAVYTDQGVNLWMGVSTISSPGLVRWLSLIGVRNFETHEPSDLEYDPQLTVVAEWRDPETLFKDHIDNAVIDVLLEGAEVGEGLPYSLALLPIVRILKAYSWVLNQFGGVGPIPEGMTATTALRIDAFAAKHDQMQQIIHDDAEMFRKEKGYNPPYWELLKLAKKAKVDVEK